MLMRGARGNRYGKRHFTGAVRVRCRTIVTVTIGFGVRDRVGFSVSLSVGVRVKFGKSLFGSFAAQKTGVDLNKIS